MASKPWGDVEIELLGLPKRIVASLSAHGISRVRQATTEVELRFLRRDKAKQVIQAAASWRRKQFKAEEDRCYVCGQAWRSEYLSVLDVHEIVRGCDRRKGYVDRRAWLLLCRRHHEEVGSWPTERQAALKAVEDPDYCDFNWIGEARCRKLDENEIVRWAADDESLRASGEAL